jgi:hypothetical protein
LRQTYSSPTSPPSHHGRRTCCPTPGNLATLPTCAAPSLSPISFARVNTLFPQRVHPLLTL